MEHVLTHRRSQGRVAPWIWDIACVALIFLTVCAALGKLYAPTIMPDEMGYWCAGAFFSGNLWTDVMQTSPYYSFGYGLILAPLFWLFEDPVWMFRTAIILNAAFLSGAFLLAQSMARSLFPRHSSALRRLVCLCLTLYSYQVYNAQGTQPDAVIVFFYWLLVWLLLRYLRGPRLYHLAGMAVVSCYLFSLHMRNLGILVALSLVLVLLAFLKRVPWRHVASIAAMVALCAGLVIFVKNYYSGQIWQGSEFLTINNTTSAFGSVLSLFTLQGLLNLLVNFLGRVFYLGCSTFFLFYWAVFIIVRDLWRAVKRKDLAVFHIMEFFALLTMLGEIGISCLFMIEPTRTDHVLYGRYHEQVLGPLLMFGLMRLQGLRSTRYFMPVSIASHLTASGLLFAYFRAFNLEAVLSPPSMAGVLGFFSPTDVSVVVRYTFSLAMFSAFIFLIFYLLLCIPKRQMVAIILTTVAAAWVILGYQAANLIFYSRTEAKAVFYELTRDMQQMWQDAEICYVVSDGHDDPANVFSNENFTLLGRKFCFPRTRMQIVTIRELLEMELPANGHRMVLLEDLFMDSSPLEEDYLPLLQGGSTQVLVPKDTSISVQLYAQLIEARQATGGLTFSAAFSSLTDNEGEVAAGMILDNYQPKDDSVGEMAKAGIRYVQVTNRALAEKMIAAGIPLEEHLFLPLRYTAAELKTNGHAPNRADEPIALRNGLVQFGPYCTLGKGVYRITVEGSGFAEHTKVRVQSGVGGKDHDIVLEQASEDKVVYQLSLEGAFENLEFCMTGIDSETVKISSLTIELLDAGSEEIIPADRLPLAQLRDEDGWTPVTAAMQQQIEALTGRHMDTNTYAAARALDLAAMVLDGDAAFSDGAVALRQGGVLRGPGEALDAGTYRVTVTGDNLTRAEFSLLTGGGETKVPVQYLSSTPGKVVYLVTLGAEVPDAEYAAYSTDTAYPVTITGIQVEQAVG